ncbi:glucose 1-dehydrogenase [Muricauda sp. HICW]|uniref:Glucose 1-dehydrogenase n=1 Tax=Flagellimonas chongwuensis TaxID=2697365 RepID=A0A850NL18_9FLAO|nr:SDR family oxidoreductase [Allomuricauda chongwuensis]NVN19075.1 glucose 1-dehydrogenase [Allomuricauda chongwuensis]
MKFSLKGKTAIVTGGGSGIGKAISLTFASQDAKVHILDFDHASSLETVAEINKLGKHAVAHTCDVSNQEKVNDIIAQIGENGSLDILVNNAGIAHVGNIEAVSEQDLDRLYNINIKGVYNCSKAIIPYMKEKGHGVILNLASVASSVGISDRFAYSMTKGAVLTMTYSIARDYVEYGIRSNCISPGRVHTPFVDGFIKKNYPGNEAEMFEKLSKTQPIGRMANPQEIADLALFLCSDEAKFITGTDYPIDGGFIKLKG